MDLRKSFENVFPSLGRNSFLKWWDLSRYTRQVSLLIFDTYSINAIDEKVINPTEKRQISPLTSQQTLQLEWLLHDSFCSLRNVAWLSRKIMWFCQIFVLIETELSFYDRKTKQKGHAYYQHNPCVSWMNRGLEMRIHPRKHINLVVSSLFSTCTFQLLIVLLCTGLPM